MVEFRFQVLREACNLTLHPSCPMLSWGSHVDWNTRTRRRWGSTHPTFVCNVSFLFGSGVIVILIKSGGFSWNLAVALPLWCRGKIKWSCLICWESWGNTRFGNVPVELLMGVVVSTYTFGLRSACCRRSRSATARPRFASSITAFHPRWLLESFPSGHCQFPLMPYEWWVQ